MPTNLGDAGLTSGDLVDPFLTDYSGDIEIPEGTYEWHGDGLDADGRDIIGLGNYGDVVFNITDGTIHGRVEQGDTLKNIVVRGPNPESKGGIDLHPGCTFDGVALVDGSYALEDRGFYDASGGEASSTLRNCVASGVINNAAYCDKHAKTVENCAFMNSNISQLRVGHREDKGTSDAMGKTTYVRNCLIALTADVPPSKERNGAQHARGLRLRHHANLVVENCWFVWFDRDGYGGRPIELHDEAGGSNVTIRNCHIHNDSAAELLYDKSGGETDLTIENCTVSGSGSRDINVGYSGDGFTEQNVTVPLPSDITGIPQADDAWGFTPSAAPFGSTNVDSGSGSDDDGTNTSDPAVDEWRDLRFDTEYKAGDIVTYTIKVDGVAEAVDANLGDGTDSVTNDPNTGTATIEGTSNGGYDTYRVKGAITSINHVDPERVTITLNGTTLYDTLNYTEEPASDDGSTDDGSGDTYEPTNVSPSGDFYAIRNGSTLHFQEQMSDTDGSVEMFFWDFGDGHETSTTESSVSHTYAQEGTYTVTLTAADDDGAQTTVSNTYDVTAPNVKPTADINLTTDGLTVYADAENSENPDGMTTAIKWDFGDGTTEYGREVSHTYSEAGTYTVTLRVVGDETGDYTEKTADVAVGGDTTGDGHSWLCRVFCNCE